MDIDRIVREPEQERDRTERAIASLKGAAIPGNGRKAAAGNGRSAPRPGRGMSAAGRKRISEMMKKRWAERRKKAAKPS